ncbi:MAG: hypothetical protein IIZ39_12345, partial [Blautia sp.]|nr:hypothetical protein [Blautia sp.]
ACESLEEGVRISQEELGRLLIAASAEEEYAGREELLALAVEAAKAAVAVLEGAGDPAVYEVRKGEAPGEIEAKKTLGFLEKKGFAMDKRFLYPCLGCALFSAILPQGGLLFFWNLIRLGLSGASLVCLGKSLIPVKEKKEEVSYVAKVRPDAERIYHELSLLCEVVEGQIKALPLPEEGFSPEQTLTDIPLLRGSEECPLSPEECKLLVALLEAAYACEDGEVSREMISLIKYFLHNQGLEAVTDYAHRRELFDLMRGPSAALIRPALVMGEILLVRGVAVLREGE